MRKLPAWLLALTLVGVSPGAAADVEVKGDEQKTLYVLGLAIGQNLAGFTLTAAELELVKAGLTDAVLNRARKADPQVYGPKIGELQKTRGKALAAVERKSGQAFQDQVAAQKDTTRTASGMVISTLKAGNGASPKAEDTVKVHYHGTLIDGSVFDSSVQRGEPAVFPLKGVIPCWTEALQRMKVGGKSRLVCPADLAYGDNGRLPRIKPGATLVFEVELIEIMK
jgi:FKBP-type peptidyl-prolyl cis-trans isomerase FkpA/FKBP-type peptidyl-prolyl cis-trans isomerase FklB